MKTSTLQLKTLQLLNFATFENQVIHFNDGLNVIVGETGSGKSLVLDALEFIFGGRADKKIIRKDCTYASIEATFECSCEITSVELAEKGFPFETDIVIKRIIFPNGKSKNYLNHATCNLADIQSVCSNFVDLVGQFENQKMLNENYQLSLLDIFCNNQEKLTIYQNKYNTLTKLQSELDSFIDKKEKSSSRIDFLKFQIAQIEELEISNEKEQKLLNEKNHWAGFEKKADTYSTVNEILSSTEQTSILTLVSKLKKIFDSNNTFFTSEDREELEKSQELLSNLSYRLSEADFSNFDQEKYNMVLDELDKIQKVKRKFGQDISYIITQLNSFRSELDELFQLDSFISKHTKLIVTLKAEVESIAQQLHENRCLAASRISQKLTIAIHELNMPGATLNFVLEQHKALNRYGNTALSFIAETNKGEGYYKVKDIASGGELSRILLTFRQILSESNTVSIFLFDEIDAGIGGKTALAIGKSLKNVSLNTQVIAITHLPQIARFATKLIHVSKNTEEIHEENRTISTVIEYNDLNSIDRFVKEMIPN